VGLLAAAIFGWTVAQEFTVVETRILLC